MRVTPEGLLKRQIVEWLSAQPGCYIRQVQIGGIRGRANHGKGISDIIGIWRGRFLAVEVKTREGRLSPEQAEFLECIRRFGGIAIVARSVGDVENNLRDEKERCRDHAPH